MNQNLVGIAATTAARIAKIPFALARHIAQVYHPSQSAVA